MARDNGVSSNPLVALTAVDGAGSLLDADFLDGISSASFALAATTITPAGLATGGGSLAANRTITVTAATDDEARAKTISTAAITPANLAATAKFRAHKNGTNQTGIATATATQITFSTEAYDVGAAFASDAWTPAAGKVRMIFGIKVTGCSGYSLMEIRIYKNGALYARNTCINDAGGAGGGQVIADDDANGTDAYTCYFYGTSGGTITARGEATDTYFCGSQI